MDQSDQRANRGWVTWTSLIAGVACLIAAAAMLHRDRFWASVLFTLGVLFIFSGAGLMFWNFAGSLSEGEGA